MSFKNILLFIFINLILSSCIKKHKSPLNININDVQSIEIKDRVVQGKVRDSIIAVDSIIPIDKVHWESLIDNFNNAKSNGPMKSMIRYEININQKGDETIKLNVTKNFFRINFSGHHYHITEKSLEILKSYHDIDN